MSLIPPQKFARFKDGVLDKSLEDIYSYLQKNASGADTGTVLEEHKYFYVAYYSGGYISTETYYSNSSRATKLRDYTYTYSSGKITKIVENIYNLGVKVSTNTFEYAYNGDGTLNTVTKTVS